MEVFMNRSFLPYSKAVFFLLLFAGLFITSPMNAEEKPYVLEWGSTMKDYIFNNTVELPDIDEGEMKNFPLHVKVIDKNTKKGVSGVRISFRMLPANSVMLNRSKPVSNENGTAQMRNRFPSVWGPKAGENRIAITAEGAENTLYAHLFGIPTYQAKAKIYLVVDKSTLNVKKGTKAAVIGRAKFPSKSEFPPGHRIEIQIMGNNSKPETVQTSPTGRFTFHIDPPEMSETVYFTVTLLDSENNKIAIKEGNVKLKIVN